MNKILLLIAIIVLFSAGISGQNKTLHDFKGQTIDGEPFDFATLKGKKVLIVNTATQCSLAPQLSKLQELYEEYGGDNFEIIAFPCNDFRNQEPGDNMHIKQICTSKYNLTFPVMEKISIKYESIHPIYQWLTNKEENGVINGRVIWNYQKFLIDEEGRPVDFYSPLVSPKSKKIIRRIEG